MHSVAGLVRYPLKSARGEHLDAADVEPGGLRGDRAWACVDVADGTMGSAKHPRRWGRLLDVGTHLIDRDGRTELRLRAGGTDVLAGTPEADAALSGYLGRAVRLSQDVPPGAKLHRHIPDEGGMVPDWMAGTRPGQDTVTAIAGAQPGGRFADYGAVHIVTTGALSTLAGQLGRPGVAAARFRPNLVLDAPHDPEPGHELRIGDAVLRVLVPTPRCVVPALGQGDLPDDRHLLTALARHHRMPVGEFGRAACFGVYAEVLRPGRLRLGERVR